MPRFQIPDAVKAAGITVYDPNDPSFMTPIIGTGQPLPDLRMDHPAFRVPSIEEHPLYHDTRCFLFDGSIPMSDGIDQAAVLSKAIVREGLPETVIHRAAHVDISEEQVRDAILHGEKYDPTLEKLPRRFDPVLFWVQHIRVHGTPVIKRLVDRDEPLSATLPTVGSFAPSPLVLRFQPHVTLQGSKPISPWATADEVEETRVDRDEPLSSTLPTVGSFAPSPLVLRFQPHVTLQGSKPISPWATADEVEETREQNAANAVMHTFGAAVAEATRRNSSRDLKKDPVVVKGVQLVDGKVDLITFQLNTLNLTSEDSTKNIVWVEKGC
ncbi:hypothetical protein OSTOST_05557 [Ostertagia ostertagi]